MGRAFEFRKARKMKRWSAMSKIFTRLNKDIIVAIREGGNADPVSNSRLRAVLQNCKAANMPKDNIARAIKKATDDAKRNLIKIPLKDGRTLHHDVKGKNGSGKVYLRSAPAGTGIIAGGAIRSVCEVLGIQDVVAKSLGSANPHNVLKACVNGLKSQNSPKILSAIRGKKISEIVQKREGK